MSTEPKSNQSQGTGHGANPTPNAAPQPAPEAGGSQQDEHFEKERVPTTKQDGETT